MSDYLIEMKSICKEFPGSVQANDKCELQIREGEIHSIVGENGAGKSTLMNVLFGLHQPDKGTIFYKNHPVQITDPRIAKNLGIEMVHQHFMLVPSFTVLQNITLGYEPKTGPFINRQEAGSEVKAICSRYSLELPFHKKVKDLSIGLQQRVEIVKALYREAEILVLDEPTAALIPQEADELFRICFEMVKQQKTILFISHKLKEVMKISDRITIMRKGKTLQTLNKDDTDENHLAGMIIGKDRKLNFAETIVREDGEHARTAAHLKTDKKILEVEGLKVIGLFDREVVKDISLHIRRAEILGIAGVEGNGQRELLDALAGLVPAAAGTVSLNGADITSASVPKRREMGLRYIPEDRLKTGLCLDAAIYENLYIDRSDRRRFIDSFGFVDWRDSVTASGKQIETYRIAVTNAKQKVGTLSGGNMQKVVAARELSASPECLIVAHPTRGVDIGSADFIYQKLIASKNNGAAVLLVSADLDELFLLSDRILVMYEGRINAEFYPNEIDTTKIGLYMTGAHGEKME